MCPILEDIMSVRNFKNSGTLKNYLFLFILAFGGPKFVQNITYFSGRYTSYNLKRVLVVWKRHGYILNGFSLEVFQSCPCQILLHPSSTARIFDALNTCTTPRSNLRQPHSPQDYVGCALQTAKIPFPPQKYLGVRTKLSCVASLNWLYQSRILRTSNQNTWLVITAQRF